MKSLTHLKKMVGICALSSLASIALATPTGFYVGATGGSSDTHNSRANFKNADKVKPQSGNVDSSGFASRLFAGFRFNRFLSAEAGYADFGTAHGSQLVYSSTDTQSGNLNENAMDIRGKLFFPIADEVDPYVSAGVARIHSKMELSGAHSKSYDEYAPEYGAGINFNISSRFVVGLSYNRVNQRNDIENADLLGLDFGIYF